MTAAVSSALRVRVSVPDVWDIVRLDAAPDWTVAQLKSAALSAATGRTLAEDDYLVKFRGAQVFDEGMTLQALGVPDLASLVVLPARRQPVR
jgi:hypothetical protein